MSYEEFRRHINQEMNKFEIWKNRKIRHFSLQDVDSKKMISQLSKLSPTCNHIKISKFNCSGLVYLIFKFVKDDTNIIEGNIEIGIEKDTRMSHLRDNVKYLLKEKVKAVCDFTKMGYDEDD